jgi:hypothetical protein
MPRVFRSFFSFQEKPTRTQTVQSSSARSLKYAPSSVSFFSAKPTLLALLLAFPPLQQRRQHGV